MKKLLMIILSLFLLNITMAARTKDSSRLRVIVTTDGEIDDECSLVRFLLYANEMGCGGDSNQQFAIPLARTQLGWRQLDG
ncbi:MAG: hypothetical protein IKK81_03270 [Prevotella sp.]|nr:hypothetical protein [Prevotella sp.]